jgi:phospholipid N-methyltransferase
MTKEEVLIQCTVDGNVVKLPNVQLERKLYQDVAKSLNLIGGKWVGGKTFGFVFNSDPTDLLNQISNGEKRNLKKEYQFFETPSELADKLVNLADLKENDIVLEPSAGQGAIIEAILRKNIDCQVLAIELMEANSLILNKKGFHHEVGDFLMIPNQPVYDKIIANPPFTANQDIDHVKHMYELLKCGGKLVSIASEHWKNSNNKKETEFRNWLSEVNANIENIPRGAFKTSGTSVGGVIITITRLK